MHSSRQYCSKHMFSKGSSVGKEFTCNAGDLGLIPGLGRSAGEGIGFPLQYSWASLVAQTVKNPPAMWETWVRSLGREDPLAEGMATHSSILALRIPKDKRSLVGCSPWGSKEWDTTEWLRKKTKQNKTKNWGRGRSEIVTFKRRGLKPCSGYLAPCMLPREGCFKNISGFTHLFSSSAASDNWSLPENLLFLGHVSGMLISFSPGLQEKWIACRRKCPLPIAASREGWGLAPAALQLFSCSHGPGPCVSSRIPNFTWYTRNVSSYI